MLPRSTDPAAGLAESAAPHPEEMTATVDLRVREFVVLKASARATPAGLVAVAVLVTAILAPAAWLARTRSRDRARLS
ncbi:hypothetical protein OPKNFCMD_4010 [Methylobacterium crusticola]|uniref:ABC transporter permease n=1 Tax=Methylobacterium crusticola TaxID=1697972 RepID=A0ABQ4R1B2_9HYPH|nr:hypothetical protein [Methylobacterium crusticola]GJD51257.1 hypothetical protein OPKNFCMD_4010 [Methylobacterium crusticola]